MVNVTTCSPGELAQHLLDHRFAQDETEVTTFLLEAVASLPNAHAISEQILQEDQTATENLAAAASMDFGNPMLLNDVILSYLQPRGKYTLQCFPDKGLLAKTPTGEKAFHVPSCTHMIVFPQPKDCQVVSSKVQTSTDVVLLVLQEPVPIKDKKHATQICFSLPTEYPSLVVNADEEEDLLEGLDHSDQWIHVLGRALGIQATTHVARVSNPVQPPPASWRYQFSSYQDQQQATTTGGMPFVNAYQGVHDGALYPLREGLLFFKPPLFLPRSSCSSLQCGRNQDASSRYVDLTVTLDNGKVIEFTNIARQEVGVLEQYIHQELIPAMQKDIDDSQHDIIPISTESSPEVDVRSPIQTQGKRKASVRAIQASRRMKLESDDEEDEDEDFDENEDTDNSVTESEDDDDEEEE